MKRAPARAARKPARAPAAPRRTQATKAAKAAKAAPTVKARSSKAGRADVQEVTGAELESLRAEIKRAGGGGPARWNANPEDVQRSVARLVLALVEFLRSLMERQAIRRMEAGTLEPEQIEAMGLALMRLEETLVDMAGRFGLTPEDLNLDLGPLGKLM
jgi:Gas vesicle protein K